MNELADQLRLPHGENSKEVIEMMARSNRSLYKFAFKNLDLSQGNKILEIGPADGHFLKELFELEQDLSYKGIDLSEEMIRQANLLNSELVKENKAEFIFGDVSKLPFENDSFDRIFTINTLYFWPDPVKGLNELTRVIRPNGKILIVIRSKETMEKMPFTQFGFRLYSEKELTDLLTLSGRNKFKIATLVETVVLPNGSSAEMSAFCAIIEKQ